MKLFIFIILLLVSYSTCTAQTYEELTALNNSGQYAAALTKAEGLIQENKNAAYPYLIAGIAWYAEHKEYAKNDSAIYYLQEAINLDTNITTVSGQANASLGQLYYNSGEKEKAVSYLDKAIEINKDNSSVDVASNSLLWILNDQKKYPEAIGLAHKMIRRKTNNAIPFLVLGKIYLEKRILDSSIGYLLEAVKYDREQTWISAWSYVDLGKAYIGSGEKEKAIIALDKATALNKTNNSVKGAQKLLASIDNGVPVNYVALSPNWVAIDAPHIRYYFQDTFGISKEVTQYINAHEDAFNSINLVFQATLPEKMSFYVWNDRELARQLLHHELGYTDVRTCTSNALIDQTAGHEMAHTLAYWGWGHPIVHVSPLINEGLAVAFDQGSNDKYTSARVAVYKKHIHSVLDIWESGTANEDILYAVGGAFVTYLHEQSKPDQFRDIVKNQSIENAESIYGKKEFHKMIEAFNNMIGL